MAFSDLKNDSLFQKIDLNLTTDFNHSQPATVCTVLNKHLTGNGNYTYFSSPNIFFSYSLVKNMIFKVLLSQGQVYFFSQNFGEMEMSK